MANVPGFINASAGAPAYDAAGLRMLDSVDLTPAGTSPLDSRAGVRPSSAEGLKVTVTGNDYSVSPGYAVLSKASQGAAGSYRAAVDTAVAGTLSVADVTNPRKDVFVLRVYDTDVDASGMRKAEVEYIVGVPAAVPAAPSTPTGALLLATATVPQSGGGSPTVVDERVYTVASGGVLPAASAPAGPYVGQPWYDTAAKVLKVWNGTVWAAPSGEGWAAYTPSLTSITLGTGGAVEGFYQRTGKTVHARVRLILGTGGSFGAGPSIGLPVSAVPGDGSRIPCGTGILRRNNPVTYVQHFGWRVAQASFTAADVAGVSMGATTPWTWAEGDRLHFEMTYEAA